MKAPPGRKGGLYMMRSAMKKIWLPLALCSSLSVSGQEALDSKSFQGLELRGIGPALMSGRIADIAIHPRRRSTWYVAVGSGGVWKTTSEPAVPGVLERIGHDVGNDWETTYGPTATHRASLAVAEEELKEATDALKHLVDTELRELDEALERAGAPWTPGRRP